MTKAKHTYTYNIRIGSKVYRYATRKTYLPHVIPYGHKEGNSANYCFGIFVSASSRADYLEFLKGEGV